MVATALKRINFIILTLSFFIYIIYLYFYFQYLSRFNIRKLLLILKYSKYQIRLLK